ncbi:hypothetical protein Pmani_023811 [Petrolisthes manimaculis]|uniref:Neurotransmitter-gated ion-channel ligand-binding domain-containing protein n=1 Tax=Petrolisthes manimaculis TaxID=1843537 RepID=A0AAE1PB09_9EUCA|nr:hypothetical protein Pmani_023811 [Petrolisthes manimaculis]
MGGLWRARTEGVAAAVSDRGVLCLILKKEKREEGCRGIASLLMRQYGTEHQEQVGAGRRVSRVRAARGGSWSRAVVAGVLVAAAWLAGAEGGNPDAKRLYDDLLSNYNKLVRPVVNVTDVLTVNIKLKLSQLIDVSQSGHMQFTYSSGKAIFIVK